MSYDVFISYRRKDGRELANNIAAHLKNIGYRVFIDTSEMVSGKPFPDQLKKQVEETPNYILVVTPEIFKERDEDWVKKEIEIALSTYNYSPETRTILPIYTSETVYLRNNSFPDWCEQLKLFDSIDLCGLRPNSREIFHIAKAVSGVNRHNLWNAAQRYLEDNKKPGRRFGSLKICSNILPLGNKKIENDFPIIGETNSISMPLLEAISQSNNHMYIIGEGGVGKTTSLIRIMENIYQGKHYCENSIIPLFVELNLAPDNRNNICYQNGKSTFIKRQICNILRQSGKAERTVDNDVEQIEDELAEIITSVLHEDFIINEPPPRYWLLLDGLNEVSQKDPYIYGMVIEEISSFLTDYYNVRVILTDRNYETQLSCEKYNIDKFVLSGIDAVGIENYLISQNLPKPQNEEILNVLSIPMYLTMYASLEQNGNIISGGELLRRFFYERSNNMYNQVSRLTAAGYDIDKSSFILDFIIPALANYMEQNEEFIIDVRNTERIVFSILEQSNDSDFIGYYGETAFRNYRKSARITVASVANEIRNSFDGNKRSIIGFILDCAVKNLGILFDKNGKYGFVHQHIRDFFAAVYDINVMKLAVHLFEEKEYDLAVKIMKRFSENIISAEKAKFIGEYLGEPQNKPFLKNEKLHYNVPSEPCDRNLIKRALAIYRNRFEENEYFAVNNLIEILKTTRHDLSGSDFSNLDLRHINFVGVKLGNKTCNSDFSGSLLNFNDSFQTIECDDEIINVIEFNNGNKCFVTPQNVILISPENSFISKIDFPQILFSDSFENSLIVIAELNKEYNSTTYEYDGWEEYIGWEKELVFYRINTNDGSFEKEEILQKFFERVQYSSLSMNNFIRKNESLFYLFNGTLYEYNFFTDIKRNIFVNGEAFCINNKGDLAAILSLRKIHIINLTTFELIDFILIPKIVLQNSLIKNGFGYNDKLFFDCNSKNIIINFSQEWIYFNIKEQKFHKFTFDRALEEIARCQSLSNKIFTFLEKTKFQFICISTDKKYCFCQDALGGIYKIENKTSRIIQKIHVGFMLRNYSFNISENKELILSYEYGAKDKKTRNYVNYYIDSTKGIIKKTDLITRNAQNSDTINIVKVYEESLISEDNLWRIDIKTDEINITHLKTGGKLPCCFTEQFNKSIRFMNKDTIMYCKGGIIYEWDLLRRKILWGTKGDNGFIFDNKLIFIDGNEIVFMDKETKLIYKKIRIVHSLLIEGCNFTHLHPESKIDAELLKSYGAITD